MQLRTPEINPFSSITICIYACICSLPWHIWWELIPNLISLWSLAHLFWPQARRISGRSAQKWGYRSPVSQTMGLFAELFLFPSVRATTKAAELWPECMWESNWSAEGEDGGDALWLEERETQRWAAEAPVSDTACCLSVPRVTRQFDEGLAQRLPQKLHAWERLLIRLVTPCRACGGVARLLWR